ncbi:hypothetical protein PpBr36_01351 [Pyricularia pennisetigena]|uniref:hypothetical protein n=1 Tax=Pyricularia pennisetigena TaxID=1578925 RepID=UPI00115062C9|nr:hypothetical protein PpBr36_01351 [Pyricularia pennisetigena]TLS28523.1 hypothetical protein PpBr36_01351 [Pyricularia pennisetigena]
MPSDLASYLADHYLTADPKPSKKRKRKHGDSKKNNEGAGLLIQDDDDDGAWTKPSSREADADELGAAAMVAGTSAEFKKATKSSWKTLGGGGGGSGNKANADQEAAAADAILASAAAENAAARAAEEDAPVVDGAAAAAVKMSDGTHAGLQTAATVAAQLRRRRAEEKAQYERERAERRAARGGGGDSSGEEETVFRDATGRRIDVSLQREQKRRAEAEKERAAKEALKGEVQIEEARRRREKLEDAALIPLARSKDDEEMNNALKSEQRWNDPMMQFMSESDRRDAGGTAKTGGRRVKGRPVYKGPTAPNRYGIRPGYRWDGVDRGIGFEAERFKALNRRERAKDLEYNWQMDE